MTQSIYSQFVYFIGDTALLYLTNEIVCVGKGEVGFYVVSDVVKVLKSTILLGSLLDLHCHSKCNIFILSDKYLDTAWYYLSSVSYKSVCTAMLRKLYSVTGHDIVFGLVSQWQLRKHSICG